VLCVATVLWRGRHALASVAPCRIGQGGGQGGLPLPAQQPTWHALCRTGAPGSRNSLGVASCDALDPHDELGRWAVFAARGRQGFPDVAGGKARGSDQRAHGAGSHCPEPGLKAAVAALAALLAVASGDPAGEIIAAWSDGVVTTAAVHQVRIAGLTVTPATAGLLLSFAWLA
jgi:hypothetical protein